MSDELLGGEGEGVSRRSMLKKSALVGGTMVWAAPVVSSFTSPAFGQTDGTGLQGDKGISYVAIAYSCTGTGERYIKFDLNAGTVGVQTEASYDCTTGNGFSTPGCTSSFPQPTRTGDTSDYGSDCDLFTIEYLEVNEDGEPTIVKVTAPETCMIQGSALGKCGNPEQQNSDGECITPTPTGGGTTITFADCGV